MLRRLHPRGSLAALVLALAWVGAPGAAEAGSLRLTVLDPQGRGLADAAVSVEARSTRGASTTARAELGQKDRQFQPQLLVIQTGTAVSFPNFDTVRHHVYSFSPVKPFEIKLYAGVPSQPVVFDRPGTAVLGCNIHDRMAAHVHVVDTPHFAKTSAQGTALLDGLPAGEHVLRIWHPSLGAEGAPVGQRIRVDAGTTELVVPWPTPP